MNLKIVICFLLCFFNVSSKKEPSASGLYTGDLNDVIDKFEIVYPEKVSKDGSFVSYYLPNYYNIEPTENRLRRNQRKSRSSEKGEIHFYIPIEGKQYHLRLWPNSDFIAPGLVVEKRDITNIEDINKAKIKQISKKQCHYSGEIVGLPNSNVALSTCYGLAGYIRVPDVDEYLIEPLRDSKPTLDKEHPHIIYKRSNLKDKSGGSNCLTKGKAKDALNERLQWEKLHGNQVHDEFSGININDLVREQVKMSPGVMSKKIDSLKHVFPQHEEPKIYNFNENQVETLSRTNNENLQTKHSFHLPQPFKNSITNNLEQINNENCLKDKIRADEFEIPSSDKLTITTNQLERKKVKRYNSIDSKTDGHRIKVNTEHFINKQNIDCDGSATNLRLKKQATRNSHFANTNTGFEDSLNENQMRKNPEKEGKSQVESDLLNNKNKNKNWKKLVCKTPHNDMAVKSVEEHNLKGTRGLKNFHPEKNTDMLNMHNGIETNENQQVEHHISKRGVISEDVSYINSKSDSCYHTKVDQSDYKDLPSSNSLNNELNPSKLKFINDENRNTKILASALKPIIKIVDGLTIKKEADSLVSSQNKISKSISIKNTSVNSGFFKHPNQTSSFDKDFQKQRSKLKTDSNKLLKKPNSDENTVDITAMQKPLCEKSNIAPKKAIEAASSVGVQRSASQSIDTIIGTNQEILLADNEINQNDLRPGIDENHEIPDGGIGKPSKLKPELCKNTKEDRKNNQRFTKFENQRDLNVGYHDMNSSNSENDHFNKRQVWPDDCAVQTSTEKHLLCFDFYNKIFNIELMITVDYKVVKMHADDDIENFILTVVNMVSSNFYDRSMGINLNVYLIRLILLTTCIKELDSDRFNAEELLENFCTWQVLINPGTDDHPHHHDLAIFVTRMDKCEGQIMGVTYMTSVCRPDKACIVCVDEGLLLANTITHQIGHALGAEHDESEGSGCPGVTPDGTAYHMAPKITETSSAWSICSKDSIAQFIKSQGSWCLTDLPVDRQFNFPIILPGQVYSAAQQCKLNFHMTAIPCLIGPFCEKLYCQVTDKLCATKGDPPADGTFCASDMWCFHKQCVHIGRRPGAVSGEWGPWTEWSLCTRSCGGGVANSYRICNNPKPANGGRYCVGERIRYRMCHTNPCQGFTESFRDFQCKKTEDKPFRGRLHNWVQYHSLFVNIECSLVCRNRKGEVVMRSPIVADGTPCKAGTRNVCVQGSCRNVGCDWVIDSMAKEDACGICQGNGSECRVVQGTFNEPATGKGLVEFLRIPKDSGMIFVREVASSANIIVVSGAINHVYYLNGQGTEDTMPGDVVLGQTHGVYEVRSGMERIFIRGPTTEDLVFHIQFQEPNRGIHYQFALPEIDPTYAPRYLWQYVDWEACTDPCSGGSQRARAKCVEDRAGVVDDLYCSESSRPMDVIRPCNDFPCVAKWWVSVWSDCICTGSTSVMFRSVLCMRATDESGTRSEIVKESECANHKKPITQKPCNVSDDQEECFAKRSAFKERRSWNTKREIISNASIKSDSSVGGNKVSQVQDKLSGNEDKKEVHNFANNQNNHSQPQSQTYTTFSVSKSQEHEQIQLNNIYPVSSHDILGLILEKPSLISSNNLNENLSTPSEPILGNGNGKMLVKADSLHNGFQEPSYFNNLKGSFKDQVNDIASGHHSQSGLQAESRCQPTQVTCPTLPPETIEATTCRQTCPVKTHKKTTCCKAFPKLPCTKPPESTTRSPLVFKSDEVNMNDFALNIVPLDIPKKKNLPQTDPEFINLGNIGQFGVGDEANGTIITGQEALDLLDFARRSNVSEESAV